MEVQVTPETAKKLNDLAAASGRAPSQIVEDALAGYLEEAVSLQKTVAGAKFDGQSDRLPLAIAKPSLRREHRR